VDIKDAERYDMDSGRWERIGDLPSPSCASAAAAGGYIFVMLWGKQVYRFDPRAGDAGSYTKVGPLPLPEWYGFALAPVGNDIYVFGGSTKGRWTNQAWRFDTRSLVWHTLPPMTSVRRRCAAAACFLPPDTPPLPHLPPSLNAAVRSGDVLLATTEAHLSISS